MATDPLDLMGLDEFQKIAVRDLMRDIEGFEWPPAPGSEHEQKLMEIGRVVMSGPKAEGER